MTSRDPNLVLSNGYTRNNILVSNILKLYGKRKTMIADVTYGMGAFWKGVVLPAKSKLLKSDLKTGIDFRNLPYPDGSVDMLFLDPPYRPVSVDDTVTESANTLKRRYGVTATTVTNMQAVMSLYKKGIEEANRVLKPKGILCIKCMDVCSAGGQWMVHVDLTNLCRNAGMKSLDLFIVTNPSPLVRFGSDVQKCARKNHSYMLLFTTATQKKSNSMKLVNPQKVKKKMMPVKKKMMPVKRKIQTKRLQIKKRTRRETTKKPKNKRMKLR